MLPIRDSVARHGPAFTVRLLIALNILVFAWQILGSFLGFERIVFDYGFIPRVFFADPGGNAYRTLTSMFLHGGVMHLIGNMWFLRVFGPTLESRLGWFRFLTLYLLAGIGAALAQGILMPGLAEPMVGASGAISGLLGGYFMLFRREYVYSLTWFILPLFFWVPVALYLGYWAVLQLVYALAGVPGTAWWAHLAGFIIGVLLAPRFRLRQPHGATPQK